MNADGLELENKGWRFPLQLIIIVLVVSDWF